MNKAAISSQMSIIYVNVPSSESNSLKSTTMKLFSSMSVWKKNNTYICNMKDIKYQYFWRNHEALIFHFEDFFLWIMHLYQTDERIGVILINEVLTHLYAVHQLVKYFSNIWTLWTIGDWSLYTTIIERKCSSIKCFLESFIIKIKPVCKVLQGVRKCLYYHALFCILVNRLNSMYSNTVTVQWLCTCL